MAIDANGREIHLALQRIRLGIDQLIAMGHATAKGQHQAPVLRIAAKGGAFRGAADGEKPFAIWKFNKLRDNHPRGSKRRVEIPNRA